MSMLTRRGPATLDASANGAAARTVVAQSSRRGEVLRRRWGRVGGGVLLAVLGGWLAASLYMSADDRVEVLVVASPVARFEPVPRSAVRVERLSADSDVAAIPAARLDEVVGRIAAADLPVGLLLADGQLFAPDARLVSADEAIVGIAVGPGEAPAGLSKGASVEVVVRYSSVMSDASAAELLEMVVPGWVTDVAGIESAGGGRSVAVVVPAADAAMVSAAAAEGRVSLVARGD